MSALSSQIGATAVAEARAVSKAYPGVQALDAVSVSFAPGEVHAIVGANGAGKSTLINLFAGLTAPDDGEIVIAGRAVSFRQPFEAIDAGVGVIHQELTVLANLSIAENIFLGHLPTTRHGTVDRRALIDNAKAIVAELELDVDPAEPVAGLPIATQQMIEIARVMSRESMLVLMDEPTSSLGPVEAERLFRIVRLLCRQGCAVVYVSHKLDEVLNLADRITVLRDGSQIFTERRVDVDEARVIGAMIGAAAPAPTAKAPDRRTPPVLEVTGLSRQGDFEDVSLVLHGGEILGMAGLVGAGRSAVAKALIGSTSADAGTIMVNGRSQSFASPADGIGAGIALVPEDRQAEGVIIDMSVGENLVLLCSAGLTRFGVRERGRETDLAEHWIERLGIRTTSPDQAVSALSGGNQQKVALGRALAASPAVLIVDEPTRGVDVGAKREIHRILCQAAADGMAILLISSEIDELLALSERIVVMRAGRVTATLKRADATEKRIAAHAFGLPAHG